MMNSHICWLLVRLAILLGVLLVQSSEEVTYQTFARSHIDSPTTRAPNRNAYCNLLMMRRGLTRPRCKPTNTFINARPSVVQQVCRRGGGRPWRQNLHDSIRRFRVVVCRNTGGQAPNRCQYTGRVENKRIRLACVNNLPVHFQQLL